MSSGRILIVEDDPILATLVSTILRRANYQVITVSDGFQALEALNVYAPDLILLDMYLPNLNGWGFLETYQQQQPGTQVPIIATSSASVDVRSLSGVSAFVPKPFTNAGLLEVIQQTISEN